MESKTPQFDALLDQIFIDLVPHTQTCFWSGKHEHCEGEFEVTAEDIEFLRSLRVPAPRYCPTCRRMRRFVHNGLTQLFKRPCNVPGHTESMISVLPSESPFPVYEYIHFIGDDFDPFQFGVDYKQGESPLAQLFELRKVFPMPSFLNRDPSSVNSEYSNGGKDLKNGYYCFGGFRSEDIWYTNLVNKSKEIMDSRAINKCDRLYGGVSSDGMYNSAYIYFSKDSSDSYFLFDCRNCADCFGCVNLRNKRYCIWNEQKTKEEYEAFMKSIRPFSHRMIEDTKEKFWNFIQTLPMNASRNISSQNTFGTLNERSSDLFDATDCDNSEHCRHVDAALSHKDSMDILFSGGHSHSLYQTINVGNQASNMKFSVSTKFSTDCEFVFNSKNLSNCFMCFGLQNKSYCVLNKQYTPEEYWPLVDQIKTDMLNRGEYGEAPDLKFSAQAYNFALAGMYFPLPEKTIRELGGYTASIPETNIGTTETINHKDIPDTIGEVTDDILNKAIICEQTGRPFRIIATELAFYRKMGLPVPHKHPSVRMEKHFRSVPMGIRFHTNCMKCGKATESIFNPTDNYILYCTECFGQEVN